MGKQQLNRDEVLKILKKRKTEFVKNFGITSIDVSVHKSQGSEYSAVVIAITTMHYPLLQRNFLYTAMTRGKHLVILVGSRRAVEIALNNNRTYFRLSELSQRIQVYATL